MNTPSISVALVTRNRSESLERTLVSLRQQGCQPFEVVVSDDSDIEHQTAVRNLAQQYDCRYVKGPRRGLYANRNHVALACCGTHIRTMDDDHEFPVGHWEACEAAVAGDPDAIWIVGEYHGYERDDPEARLRVPGDFHPRGFIVPPSECGKIRLIADGSSIFPKAVFNAGHRYAEYFIFGQAFIEFGMRLDWLGYPIRQIKDTFIIHHVDPKDRSVMNEAVALSSRLFAMFCRALIYRKRTSERLITFAEVARSVLRSGPSGMQCLLRAWSALRQQQVTSAKNAK